MRGRQPSGDVRAWHRISLRGGCGFAVDDDIHFIVLGGETRWVLDLPGLTCPVPAQTCKAGVPEQAERQPAILEYAGLPSTALISLTAPLSSTAPTSSTYLIDGAYLLDSDHLLDIARVLDSAHVLNSVHFLQRVSHARCSSVIISCHDCRVV